MIKGESAYTLAKELLILRIAENEGKFSHEIAKKKRLENLFDNLGGPADLLNSRYLEIVEGKYPFCNYKDNR